MCRSVTLLPVPDGPINTVISPRGMRTVTPSSTLSEPNALCTSCSSMTASFSQVCCDCEGGRWTAGAPPDGRADQAWPAGRGAGGTATGPRAVGGVGWYVVIGSYLNREVGVGTPEELCQERVHHDGDHQCKRHRSGHRSADT